MKVLVLSSRPPWPATRADQLTVDRTVRWLRAQGHEIHLACLVAYEGEAESLHSEYARVCPVHAVVLPTWRSYLETIGGLLRGDPLQVGHFRSGAFAREVERLVAEHDYDLVYAHLIRTSEYARRLPCRACSACRSPRR